MEQIKFIKNPSLEKTVVGSHQIVDPEVSTKKFEHETGEFMKSISMHRQRGVLVLDCTFPDLKLAFCATNIKPAPIVFAVNINFTNYDLEPLSVRFIDPFTFELINAQQLNHSFKRKVVQPNGHIIHQPLCRELNALPFICIPGIREYHKHPDHSNDPWLDHRGKGGEGSLGFIVDKLWLYGIQALAGYNIQVVAPQLPLGIDINKVPE